MKQLAVGLRILFALLAAGLLLYILTHLDEKDADIVFIVCMTALTFPVGVIVTLAATVLLGLVLMTTGIQFGNSVPFYLVLWSIYTMAGYMQWFYALPKLHKKQGSGGRGDELGE